MTDPDNVVSLADHRDRTAARHAPLGSSLAALPEYILDLQIRNEVETLIRQHGSFREAVVTLAGSVDADDREAAQCLRDWAATFVPAEPARR